MLLQLLIALITVFAIGLNYLHQDRKDAVAGVTHDLQDLQRLLVADILSVQEFLTYDMTNEEFFMLGKSEYVSRHEGYKKDIQQKLEELIETQSELGFELDSFLSSFQLQYGNMVESSEKIIALVQTRGFKDYGLEGEMREKAHSLQDDFTGKISRERVLILRRHEKDFLLRKYPEYRVLFLSEVESLRTEIENNNRVSESERLEMLATLDQYSELFGELVELNLMLGVHDNSNSMHDFSTDAANARSTLAELLVHSIKSQHNIMKLWDVVFWTALIIVFVVLLLLAQWQANRITTPIIRLTSEIDSFNQSGFSERPVQQVVNRSDEIGSLILSFNIMQGEILKLLTGMRTKMAELEHARTKLIKAEHKQRDKKTAVLNQVKEV